MGYSEHKHSSYQCNTTRYPAAQGASSVSSMCLGRDPHGNGLIIKDRHSKQAIKGSSLDKTLSRGKQEARFGVYEPPQGLEHVVQEHSRYEAAPLHRSWSVGRCTPSTVRYCNCRAQNPRLEEMKQSEILALAVVRKRWSIKHQELKRMSIDKRKRRGLLQLSRKYEAEEFAKAKVQFQEPRDTVLRKIPYASWNAFLQHTAEQGNKVALAVLQTAEMERETSVPPKKDCTARAGAVQQLECRCPSGKRHQRTGSAGKHVTDQQGKNLSAGCLAYGADCRGRCRPGRRVQLFR